MEDNISKKIINAETFFTKVSYMYGGMSTGSYLYTNKNAYGQINPTKANYVELVGLKDVIDEIVQLRIQQAFQDLKIQLGSAILSSSEEIYSDLFINRTEV